MWVWDHSNTQLVFMNWDLKGPQPGDGKDETCVLSKFGLWHDYPCHYTFNIMCESGE